MARARDREVLVLGGSPERIQALSSALEKCGHSVVAATSGTEALDALAARERLPALVLVDFDLHDAWAQSLLEALNEDQELSAVPMLPISVTDQALRPSEIDDVCDAVAELLRGG